MVDHSDVSQVRRLLAKLCRMPEHRVVAREVGVERQRWQPFAVRDATLMGFFTDSGAWLAIADFLDGEGKVSYSPPSEEFDDHAYIMIDEGISGRPVYAKVALNMKIKKIIGISFHYAR